MPYYLSPYEKVPVRDTVQCQPVGCEGVVRGPIDLRPDGGATLEGGGLNACLLWLPSASGDWRLEKIAEAAEEPLAHAARRRMASLFWMVEVAGSTFASTVLGLLLTPPPHGWKPLRPTWDGFYDVWLGNRLLHRLKPIRGGTTITEDFNTGDQVGLGPDLSWTVYFNSGAGSDVLVTNNQARNAADSEWEARADVDLATDDHYAQAVAGADYAADAVGPFIGVVCRKDSTATRTCYRWSNFGASGGWELVKHVDGTETLLDGGGAYTTDPVAADSFRIEADGSTIKGFHTGTERVSDTDTAVTGNLRCGIHLGASQTAYLDNFEAGDLAGGVFDVAADGGSYAITGTAAALTQVSPRTWLRVAR